VSTSMVPMVITLYGTGMLISSGIAYFIAASKHRDAQRWAFLGFIFPPLALLTLLLPRLTSQEANSRLLRRDLIRAQRSRDDD
jgi:hypothetical protein